MSKRWATFCKRLTAMMIGEDREVPVDARFRSDQSATLGSEATTRIELVRARHETRIRQKLVRWFAEARSASTPTLTGKQQSELRKWIITMWVRVMESEGRERLAISLSPEQFESDIHHLIDTAADKALVSWRALTRTCRLEEEVPEGLSDAELDLRQSVKDQLMPKVNRLVLQAWSNYKRRLEEEFLFRDQNPEPGRNPTEVSVLATPVCSQVVSSLAQRIEGLRFDKGWTLDELARNAGLDKKTLIRINKGNGVFPGTLKKIADALDVTVGQLRG